MSLNLSFHFLSMRYVRVLTGCIALAGLTA